MDSKKELVTTNSIKLANDSADLANQLINETDPAKIKQYYELFNMLQSKKDLLRNITLNDLLDKVQEQAMERFENNPDEVTNKELLDYMQVIQAQIEHNRKSMVEASAAPMIQLNNQEINVNVASGLPKSSRDKVLAAIQAIIQSTAQESKDVVDLDLTEGGEVNND